MFKLVRAVVADIEQSHTFIRATIPYQIYRRVKSMVTKTVWAAAAAAIIIIIVLASTYYYYNYASPSPGPSQLLTPTDQADLNWAGYSVASNFSDPKPVVTGVTGSWVVPEVQISQNDTFSAVWIGIGGTFGHTLIQTGTEQDCINGTLYYSAWYELLPNYSDTITTIEVSPGDTITASINLVNSAENLWSVYISDTSTGQSFNQTFSYNSSRLSAEWVVERPDVDNKLSQVANFGSVTLSNCKATMANEVEAFGYFPSIRMFMYNMRGTRLADVSNYSSDGSSFTVEYLTS